MSEQVFGMTRGDREPALTALIGDRRAEGNFLTIDKSAVSVQIEHDGVIVLEDGVDIFAPAPDGLSAVVARSWRAGETDVAGRHYVRILVDWGNENIQTFPRSGPLRLDIRRKAGDD